MIKLKNGMPKKIQLVEIARSFSYSNKEYGKGEEFFCSQKAECLEKDAEKTSEAIYQFCKSQVMKSVNEWLREKAQTIRSNDSTSLKSRPLTMKLYEAKPTDSWRGDNSPKYTATERSDNGEFNKVLINKEENTLQPY